MFKGTHCRSGVAHGNLTVPTPIHPAAMTLLKMCKSNLGKTAYENPDFNLQSLLPWLNSVVVIRHGLTPTWTHWVIRTSIYYKTSQFKEWTKFIRMQKWKPAYVCCAPGNAFKTILHPIHRTLEKSLSSSTPSAASWLALGDSHLGLASLISRLSFSLMF